MKDSVLTVERNYALTGNVYKMRLRGDTSAITRPGQFINIRIENKFLRRPISVYDYDNETLSIIYKVVGSGTRILSEIRAGERLNALTGLGNGYDITDAGNKPLLIGGGVGVPPLHNLARRLRAEGITVQVVIGFNTEEEIICESDFRAIGCSVTVATADGSRGVKGFVTDALPENYSYIYTCGPEPMLKAVYKSAKTSGQFSFESRMGCGFGACMGCSCMTITGYKRICKDGPVLRKEEILWED